MIKAMDQDREVRIVVARSTGLVEDIASRHEMSATARAATGRLVTGALLLASDLKAGNGVTVHVNGGGPIGDMVAVAEPEGTARAFVNNPQADLPSVYPGKLDVGGLVGRNGEIRVIKDLGMKQPFIGSVPLQTGEIGDDLAYYLLFSEQIPSLVALGVLVDVDLSVISSGGLLIQAMPGADEEKLARFEENVRTLGPVSSALKSHPDLESIRDMVAGEYGFQVLETIPISFRCKCSQDKTAQIVLAMPDEDIEACLEEKGVVEVRCNFCNQVYTFDRKEVKMLRQNR